VSSEGAKGGFANERELIKSLNSLNDRGVEVLKLFGVEIHKVGHVRATKAGARVKPDIIIEVFDKKGDIFFSARASVKLVSSPTDFNQIDRGRVKDRYRSLWPFMSEETASALQLFTGDSKPNSQITRDKRRMFLDEMSGIQVASIRRFFETYKDQILADILRGAPPDDADWMLVVDKYGNRLRALPMEDAIAFFGTGEVKQSPRGSLYIGRVFMQRKGGDKGKASANDLQFKIHPSEILD
jgi:hypothetical protein